MQWVEWLDSYIWSWGGFCDVHPADGTWNQHLSPGKRCKNNHLGNVVLTARECGVSSCLGQSTFKGLGKETASTTWPWKPLYFGLPRNRAAGSLSSHILTLIKLGHSGWLCFHLLLNSSSPRCFWVRDCPFPQGCTSSYRVDKREPGWQTSSLYIHIQHLLTDRHTCTEEHCGWSSGVTGRWPPLALIAWVNTVSSCPVECGRQLRVTWEFQIFFSQESHVHFMFVIFLNTNYSLLYYENIGSLHENCRRLNQSL